MAAPLAFLGPVLDLLGTVGINIYNQEQQKKKNEVDYKRQLEAEQREYQRNLELWNMQNAYNHPLEQMNRLRQAGLNPNLVYGKGADNTAMAIQGTKSKAPEYGIKDLIAPTFGNSISNALTAHYNTEQTKVNIDQTHEAIALMQKEQLIKDAEIANKSIQTAKTQYDLELAKELKETTIEKAKLENTSLETFTQIGIDRNEREKLMNATDLELKAQEIINKKAEELLLRQKYASSQVEVQKIQAEIQNLKVMNQNLRSEGFIKQFEADMAKKGIPKNSPWWWQNLNSALSGPPADMNMSQQQKDMYIRKSQYTPSTTRNYLDGWNWK